MKCRFVFPEQISGIRYSAVPGLHSLPALFLFLLQVIWGGERAWVPPGHSFGMLPCSVRSALQVYAVWRSPLSCCYFRISCINYIFTLYAVLGGGLCLTSHATMFNPLFPHSDYYCSHTIHHGACYPRTCSPLGGTAFMFIRM